MGVVRTDQWLTELYDDPIQLCKKLQSKFPNVTPNDLYEYLQLHGMYRPLKESKEVIAKLKKRKVWHVVQREFLLLQEEWSGSKVPIYIFPVDTRNRKIVREFNEKSGLAFNDKLFLFLSPNNEEEEIKALLTHEYNHVCRLKHNKKTENEYTLLDSIIIEGLAEGAVLERCGKTHLASWTSYYTRNQAYTFWRKIIKDHKDVKKDSRRHNDILYGTRLNPKMVGYAVGYHIVQECIEHSKLQIKDLLSLSSDKILQLSKFAKE